MMPIKQIEQPLERRVVDVSCDVGIDNFDAEGAVEAFGGPHVFLPFSDRRQAESAQCHAGGIACRSR